MKLIFLPYFLTIKVAVIKPIEYSSKGVIPSYDKVPIEHVEIPDVLKREYDFLLIPHYITPKPSTNNGHK